MMAARLCDLHKDEDPEPMETDQPTYSVPANLAAILKVYGLNTPPANITVHQVFDKLIAKVCPTYMYMINKLQDTFQYTK